MREAGGKLAQGAIIWANVSDPRGYVKRHPLVIITDSTEIVLDRPFVGVAVTTTYPDPPTIRHVELPWSPRGHPATRLARRSAAVCDWLVELRASQVEEIKGFIPTKTLIQILERVRALHGPQDNSGNPGSC